MSFTALGLAEPILRALAADGYETPTPIQAKAIPVLLEGRDLIGIAQTGTGKTAAFALPLLQRLADSGERAEPRRPRALVLAPTRELAAQIGECVARYGRHLGIRHSVIYGGVGQGPQVQQLGRGVDVLIATPGRLIDLFGQNYVRFDRIKHLVLDEADRMLDMGFIHDIRRIVREVPKARQTVLTSATMPAEIARLAGEILSAPERVEVAPQGRTVDRIAQHVHHVDAKSKRGLLRTLLGDATLSRVIVFTRTKHGANRVATDLEKAGIAAEAIHGNKSQNARQRALDGFREGTVRVLVATDIAARGLDIDDVTHVVNFDIPNEPETYVHRIGRTARAGSSGIAISFCAPDERGFLKDIEKLTRVAVTVAGKVRIEEPAAEPVSARDETATEAPRRERGGRSGVTPRRDERRGGDRRGRDGGAGEGGGRHARADSRGGEGARAPREGRADHRRGEPRDGRGEDRRQGERNQRGHHARNDKGGRTGDRPLNRRDRQPVTPATGSAAPWVFWSSQPDTATQPHERPAADRDRDAAGRRNGRPSSGDGDRGPKGNGQGRRRRRGNGNRQPARETA
ncbi:MAG: DEAD/DEAH box helicase [Hyphomicrobiaceae bacterium]